MSDENDDLLNPDEIEALLNEAGAGQSPTPPPRAEGESAAPAEPAGGEAAAEDGDSEHLSQDELDRLMSEATQGTASLEKKAPAAAATPPVADGGDSDLLDPGEIEKLLNAAQDGAGGQPAAPAASSLPAGTEELLEQAEAGLAAAIANDSGGAPRKPAPFGNPKPFSFQEFGRSPDAANDIALQTLHDVELDIRIELGRTELLIDEVLKLRDGSVVPLDKLAGDPVDVIVNERLIARGEVLVLNDNFCVRITEILPPQT